MTEFRRASLLAAMLVSIALTVGACGGAAATPTPVPVGEATSTPPAAEITPTPETPPGAEATPDVAIPTFDLGGLTNNLENVGSYQISISVAGSTVYHATVVSEPEKAEEISLGEGDDVTKVIRIGSETWVAIGGEPYTKDDLGMANALVGSFSPLLLIGAFANGNIAAVSTDLGSEQKNGVNAKHYRFDSSSTLAGSFSFPAGAGLDFWVADDGFLVAYEFTGTAADQNISINVTNVDDPANKVERPR
ncbi:MAG: hypothetical protein Q7S35_02330 [Candidatus Limnocylindrales bacterium]|nr:hypothetical protein [Candidatus Limnocylindrales bacterium]